MEDISDVQMEYFPVFINNDPHDETLDSHEYSDCELETWSHAPSMNSMPDDSVF